MTMTMTLSNPLQLPESTRDILPRIPLSSYRHAGPSGPWPWMDMVEEDRSLSNGSTTQEAHADLDYRPKSWRTYPTNLFPNWDSVRVRRSRMASVINRPGESDSACIVYYVKVGQDGRFSKDSEHYTVAYSHPDGFLDHVQKCDRASSRVNLLFVENLSGPVLQMLGTVYNIEPFFFSSSINWIPSRYQENPQPNEGDHITITLNFIKAVHHPTSTHESSGISGDQTNVQYFSETGAASVDTQGPLFLFNDRVILLDLLAIHMVRRKNGSTIISYHPPREWKSTSALYLRTLVRHAGESIYWQSLFEHSEDPTLVLLCILWYALYAWDEALEKLYEHICWLESRVLKTNDTNDVYLRTTRELYIIRASLLHYTSLLQTYKKTVMFVQSTPNPALTGDVAAKANRLMAKECDTLIAEIDRLEMFRATQDMRLKNVMDLAYASVNIADSRYTRSLSEAALRDSTVMKQISYMTMIFLPASLATGVFGMNITRLEDGTHATVLEYLAVTLLLTVFTVWIMVAIHRQQYQKDKSDSSLWHALQWPVLWVKTEHHRSKSEAVGALHGAGLV